MSTCLAKISPKHSLGRSLVYYIRANLALVSGEYLFWSWSESILRISCQKLGFYQWQDMCLLWRFLILRKNGQLCGTLVTKPLDLHRLMGYHMKDNILIFLLVPSKPVSDHWNCHRKVQEKVAWSCEHQKVDISPVLSYSTTQHLESKQLADPMGNFLGQSRMGKVLNE